MSIWRLVLCEIAFRKVNFLLALVAVVAAVASLTAVLTLLRGHDLRTDALLAEREKLTQEEMRELEDNYRKITKDLGFNLRIFHKDQDAAEFHRKRYASRYLPDDSADKLAKARVLTVNHLLPILHEVVVWEEKGDAVHVVGTRGEIPIVGADKKKPLVEAVSRGSVVLGADIQKRAGVKAGESIVFQGKAFKVKRVHPPRGSEEDITLWLNLADAQELLDRRNLINVVLALECACEADRLDRVKEEVTKVLPDTQVMEMSVMAEGRARARNQASATAKAAVAQIKKDRETLRAGRLELAAVLLPVVLLASTVWLGGLILLNTRERRAEIGVLRALGTGTARVSALVLARAILLGLVGGGVGLLAGAGFGLWYSEINMASDWWQALVSPWPLPLAVVAAPLWCALAAGIPAIWAAHQDPASILGEP